MLSVRVSVRVSVRLRSSVGVRVKVRVRVRVRVRTIFEHRSGYRTRVDGVRVRVRVRARGPAVAASVFPSEATRVNTALLLPLFTSSDSFPST